MKQKSKSLLIILLLPIGFGFVMLINSCGAKSETEYKKNAPDTTVTFINFVTPLDWAKSYNIDPNQSIDRIAWRLTKDTFAYTSIDTNTITKTWIRDTTYAIQINVPTIDSLNKPILDTAGKPKLQPIFPLLNKRFVLHDYNKNPNKQ